LGVKNWQTQLFGRVHYHATRRNLESRTQLEKPVECASGGNPLLLYKILHLLFFLLIQILCALRLESQKNYQHGHDAGPLKFQFVRPRGCLTNPFRTLSLYFGVIGKNQVSSPVIILLKKCLSASAIAIMSWKDVTQSSLCSGVEECGTKHAHNSHFPKSAFRIGRTTVLGMFKDSAIIHDVI